MPIVDGLVTTPLVLQDTLDLFELMEARGHDHAHRLLPRVQRMTPQNQGELMADSMPSWVVIDTRYLYLGGPNMREYFASSRRVGRRSDTGRACLRYRRLLVGGTN